MRFGSMGRLVLGAAMLALTACGGGGSDTPAGVAEVTTIDFANVANYSAPTLPAYFDRTVAALDNSPASNAVDDRVATLGRVLFYDLRLSTNDRASCASCHQQEHGFTDPMRFSNGISSAATTDAHAMRLGNLRYWQPGTDLLGPARGQRGGAGEPPDRTAWSKWAGAGPRAASTT